MTVRPQSWTMMWTKHTDHLPKNQLNRLSLVSNVPFFFPLQGLNAELHIYIIVLDLSDSEASVMDHDVDETHPLPAEEPDAGLAKEKATGASQQYDPLTMPSLPGIPDNILIQFLASCFCFIGVWGY